MTRKLANPRPWHCIACGAELPPERQQGRCLECLIGKRPTAWDDHTTVLGSIVAGPRYDPVEPDYSFLDDGAT